MRGESDRDGGSSAIRRVRGLHVVGLSQSARRQRSFGDISNLLSQGLRVLPTAAKEAMTVKPPKVSPPSSIQDATPSKQCRVDISSPSRPLIGSLRFSRSASTLATPTQKVDGRGETGAADKSGRYGDIGISNPQARANKDGGYSSLQEMLESSGFADTRVITPRAAVESNLVDLSPYSARSPPTRSSTDVPSQQHMQDSVYPPSRSGRTARLSPAGNDRRTLRPVTSISIIKGMMSILSPPTAVRSGSTTVPSVPFLPSKSLRSNTRGNKIDGPNEMLDEERGRHASRRMAQEWAENVARASLEMQRTDSHDMASSARSYSSFSSIIAPKGTRRDRLSPRLPSPSPAPAFAFQPRPLILRSTSAANSYSSAASSASSASFSSRTMGRRVFSRADEDEMEVQYGSSMIGGATGAPMMGYQSFSLGIAGNFHDEEINDVYRNDAVDRNILGQRQEYDDFDDTHEESDGGKAKAVAENVSTSQGILSATLKHWQSLLTLPTLLLQATPAASSPTCSASLSTTRVIGDGSIATPLPYSSSLPRPSFLDTPYRPATTLPSLIAGRARSSVDLRRAATVAVAPAGRTMTTAGMKAPSLMRKFSNPSLRSKAAAVRVTMEKGAATML